MAFKEAAVSQATAPRAVQETRPPRGEGACPPGALPQPYAGEDNSEEHPLRRIL